MQITLLEVHHPPTVGRLDVSVANVPLFGHGPIEHNSPGWHLESAQRHVFFDQGQRPPDPVTRDTPADRVQLRGKLLEFFADLRCVSLVELFQ
jgi:hypothetical protein